MHTQSTRRNPTNGCAPARPPASLGISPQPTRHRNQVTGAFIFATEDGKLYAGAVRLNPADKRGPRVDNSASPNCRLRLPSIKACFGSTQGSVPFRDQPATARSTSFEPQGTNGLLFTPATTDGNLQGSGSRQDTRPSQANTDGESLRHLRAADRSEARRRGRPGPACRCSIPTDIAATLELSAETMDRLGGVASASMAFGPILADDIPSATSVTADQCI